MKKFLFLILIMIMLSINVYAKMDLFYDGVNHVYEGPDVTLIINNKKFTPTEGLLPPLILDDRTLVPVREVFEMMGGVVDWDGDERSVTITADSKTVKLWIDQTNTLVDGKEVSLDVPAKIINDKTMVPVRFISENCGFIVGWDGENKTVTVDSPDNIPIADITSVSYQKINNTNCIVVKASSVINGYKYFSLEEPDRLILDVQNSKFACNTDIQNISDDIISTIRFGKQENNVNRIVVDLTKKQDDYVVAQSEDMKTLYFAFADKFDLPGTTIKPVNDTPSEEVIPTEVPIDEGNTTNENEISTDEENIANENIPEDNVLGEDTKPDDEIEDAPIIDNPPVIDAIITGMKYNSTSDRTRIIFSGTIKDYDSFYLTNPTRLVIDIYNSELNIDGPTTITPKNKTITSIRIAQNDESTVRVVFDLNSKVEYDLVKKSTEIQVNVTEPSYRNVTYSATDVAGKLTLKNVDIDNLTLTQNKSKKTYTITYSSSKFDSGKGELSIDDDFAKDITITKTKITIKDVGNIKYTAKQSGDNVVITMKDKSTVSGEKIILLDAGHGGNDPGSNNNGYYEKTYNLKVLLELEELLESAGYEVYATRETDKTLTVDDRVELATEEYPEAMLYVSIHHNSVENKNYSGTLVMYCNRDTSEYGITNKRFAELVSKELISNLGTQDRGFILVKENDTSKRVLTEVPMPSILCELAFISNDEELERIKTKEFQRAAAKAIFGGIEKALEEMD